jgi:syntaxin-binding protein 1
VSNVTRTRCLTVLIGLDPQLRNRITSSQAGRDQIADLRVMNINYFPRESHVALLRDPWSFPTLFHPACNNLVRRHLEELSRKVCCNHAVCDAKDFYKC